MGASAVAIKARKMIHSSCRVGSHTLDPSGEYLIFASTEEWSRLLFALGEAPTEGVNWFLLLGMMILRNLPAPLLRTLLKMLTRCVKTTYLFETGTQCPTYLSKIRDLSILPNILHARTPWWKLTLQHVAALSIRVLTISISSLCVTPEHYLLLQ